MPLQDTTRPASRSAQFMKDAAADVRAAPNDEPASPARSSGRAPTRSARRSRRDGAGGAGDRQDPAELAALSKRADQAETRAAVLAAELTSRKESHIRREQRLNEEMATMRSELDNATAGRGLNTHMVRIREAQTAIQERLRTAQKLQADAMGEQQRELRQSFEAKLKNVDALHKKQSHAAAGAEKWRRQAEQLAEQLHTAQAQAEDADRKNQLLREENQRLRAQFRTQEDDREFLVRQLVSVKRDNTRLKEEMKKAAARGQPDRMPALQRPQTAPNAVSMRPHSAEVGEARLRGVIERQRKLLDKERSALRKVRAQFASTSSNRSDLETILSECLRDVRAQIASQRHSEAAEMSKSASWRPSTAASANAPFGTAERQQLIAKLLGQERVLSLIQGQTSLGGGGSFSGEPTAAIFASRNSATLRPSTAAV